MPRDPFPIRPIVLDELAEYLEAEDNDAFSSDRSVSEQVEAVTPLFEPGRWLAAWDDNRVVGGAFSTPLAMTVPGGVTAVAGVSGVGVRQSHRRQGIFRSLMVRQLRDLYEGAGGAEPLAALFASEAGIYGRVGYGAATTTARWTFRRGDAEFVPSVSTDPKLRFRAVEPATAVPEMAAVFDARLRPRCGEFARNETWWRVAIRDHHDGSATNGPLRCILAEDGAGPRGYALFRMRSDFDDDDLPDSRLFVREAHASDLAAYVAIWDQLLHRDLVGEVVAPLRAVDDPLLHMLADPRRARVRCGDGLWIRLVEVAQGLRQRRYACPVDMVLAVTDETCPWNVGRYRLSGDRDGATCEPTSAAADVSLPVTALGSAYLGDGRLMSLVDAGLVEEMTPGAARTLATAMSWDPAPHSGMIF